MTIDTCHHLLHPFSQGDIRLTKTEKIKACFAFLLTPICFYYVTYRFKKQHIQQLRSCPVVEQTGLKALRKVYIQSEQDFEGLEGQENLSIKFPSTTFDPSYLEKLRGLDVRSLKMFGCDFDNQDCSVLATLPLERLNIGFCHNVPSEILNRLHGIKKLNIANQSLTLPAWPNLTKLNLDNCKLTKKNFSQIRKYKYLKKLSLSACSLTDKNLREIGKMSSLESLNLANSMHLITDRGLKHLSSLFRLRSIELYGGKKITNKGVRHFTKLVHLHTLYIDGAVQITDVAVRYLSKLPQLKSLGLSGCKIHDSSVELLPEIESLDLSDCPITGAGLGHLSKVKRLYLSQIQEEYLEQLFNLKDLQSLRIKSLHNLSREGIAKVNSIEASWHI